MTLKKPIVLIGPQGSGKTTVARSLAGLLKVPMFDTNDVFKNLHRRISPAQYMRQYGPFLFRESEAQILRELTFLPSIVISTGDGIVYPTGMNLELKYVEEFAKRNQRKLKKGFTIYLQYSKDISEEARTLVDRINADKTSSFQRIPFDNFEAMLRTRNPHYEKAANYIVQTKGLNQDQIAQEILENTSSLIVKK